MADAAHHKPPVLAAVATIQPAAASRMWQHRTKIRFDYLIYNCWSTRTAAAIQQLAAESVQSVLGGKRWEYI